MMKKIYIEFINICINNIFIKVVKEKMNFNDLFWYMSFYKLYKIIYLLVIIINYKSVFNYMLYLCLYLI